MGFPTVTITTTEFAGLAADTAMSEGVPDAPFVVVSHPMGMIGRSRDHEEGGECLRRNSKDRHPVEAFRYAP